MKVYRLIKHKKDVIKERILYKITLIGLCDWNAPKKLCKIKEEMYNEVKSANDLEKHIKDHINECGMKGKLYKELLDYYNYLNEGGV